MPDNGSKPSLRSDGKLPAALDPLAEAEAVRTLLAEAQPRLARLIASIKQFRRPSRALRTAVRSMGELLPLTP